MYYTLLIANFWMDYSIILKYKTFPDSLCWFWQSVEWLLCEELGNFLQISKGCGIYARSRVPLPVPTVRKLTLAYEWCPLITNVNKQPLLSTTGTQKKKETLTWHTYGIEFIVFRTTDHFSQKKRWLNVSQC